jgi:hypothetical protein
MPSYKMLTLIAQNAEKNERNTHTHTHTRTLTNKEQGQLVVNSNKYGRY